jgi:uncharacterized protein (DUF302 family)
MSKIVACSFEEAVARTVEGLKKEGFGILTEIDVQETLKKKLGVDFRKYRILGACNPPFAYQALLAEEHLGILLPCNFVVQEHADGRVEVSAVDPITAMQVTGNPQLSSYAEQVKAKLSAVLEAL